MRVVFKPERGGLEFGRGAVVALLWTSIYDQCSGSMKIITRLDHIGHCKTASGTDWSNRWIYRVFIVKTRRDLIKVSGVWVSSRTGDYEQFIKSQLAPTSPTSKPCVVQSWSRYPPKSGGNETWSEFPIVPSYPHYPQNRRSPPSGKFRVQSFWKQG